MKRLLSIFRKKVPRRDYLRSGEIIAKWYPDAGAYYCFLYDFPLSVQHKEHAFCSVDAHGIHQEQRHRWRCTVIDAVDFGILLQLIKQELRIETLLTLTQ